MREYVSTRSEVDRTHRRTKKQPGHGQESVAGCQACALYDMLDEDNEDSNLELETVLQVANDLVGDVANRPTGKPSA